MLPIDVCVTNEPVGAMATAWSGMLAGRIPMPTQSRGHGTRCEMAIGNAGIIKNRDVKSNLPGSSWLCLTNDRVNACTSAIMSHSGQRLGARHSKAFHSSEKHEYPQANTTHS